MKARAGEEPASNVTCKWHCIRMPIVFSIVSRWCYCAYSASYVHAVTEVQHALVPALLAMQ